MSHTILLVQPAARPESRYIILQIFYSFSLYLYVFAQKFIKTTHVNFYTFNYSTYSDYESVNECMEGVCKIYEEHLKRRNPNTPTITYDISQLFDFLDQVTKYNSFYFYNQKPHFRWKMTFMSDNFFPLAYCIFVVVLSYS